MSITFLIIALVLSLIMVSGLVWATGVFLIFKCIKLLNRRRRNF